jgi:ribosomal protein S18 acetylase RimI-like enzyme
VRATGLGRIAANVLETGAMGRRSVALAGWRAFLAPAAADDATSFAVPTDGAAAGPASLDALFALFAREGRPLRVEMIDELHPGLAALLVGRGLALRMPPLPGDVQALPVGTADVETMLAIQDASYPTPLSPGGRPSWGEVMAAGLAAGRVVALIAHRAGRPVATAALLVGAGAAELAGVATLPGERRRGLASALCARLLTDAFATPAIDLAWLSAATPAARHLYARLGFAPAGTQVNLAREQG